MVNQKPIFKVFFLKEQQQEESYSTRLLLGLKKVLGDNSPLHQHDSLQTICGPYGGKDIQIDVISRCSTAFNELNSKKNVYDLIVLPNHGPCFASQLEKFCRENEKTASTDQIILREMGPLLEWSTRKERYDINELAGSKDIIHINADEDNNNFLINTIISFFEKVEISISYDKDFNRTKIEKLNSTLRKISPYIETRQQPKSTLGKDVIIQIASNSSAERSAVIEIDECKVYFNCSNSFINITKAKIKNLAKTMASRSVKISHDQLQEEVIKLIDHHSLEQFHSVLSRQGDDNKITSETEEFVSNGHSHYQYYKDQISEVKKIIEKGVGSEERVQIQNILETIDRRKLHQKSKNAVKLAFISYAHAGENKEHVWNIASQLICEGVDIRIDQYYSNPGDWKKWMETHISNSDHVIQFFSSFNRVATSFPEADRGRGILFEADIINGESYRRDLRKEKKFIYVLHDDDDDSSEDHLPPSLRNTGRHIYYYPSQLDEIVSFVKEINLP